MTEKEFKEPTPSPHHRRIRELCRDNLLRFGRTYVLGIYAGKKPLMRRPPSPRIIRSKLRFPHPRPDIIIIDDPQPKENEEAK